MRRIRFFGRFAAAVVLSSAAVIGWPGPAAAECTYIPPLPKVSIAIGTAKELFVGEVIANGQGKAIFTLQVGEVLRGPAKVGDRRTFEWVEPNWPWGGPKSPSCSYLSGTVGETLIVALEARTSGMTRHDYNVTWYQPPTTFNTVGIVNGSSREQYGPIGRQLFSLDRLRELARLSPPATDTASEAVAPLSRELHGDVRPVLVAVIALSVGVAVFRRRPERTR